MKCFGSSVKVYRCKIVLLDETELIQEIKDSHKGQDILDIVFKHLDLLETVYFGLRFIDSKGFSCWLEPNKNAIKQVKEIEPITFFFGVKFYASDPCKLREECTRYQFFLQIKQDIQQSRLSVTNELAAQLLAYIIQSELGDYDPKIHQFGYVSEFCWIENQSLDFENKVCDLHKKLIGQIPAAVEMQFLERVKWLDLYGCELHSVVAEDRHEYFLGLGPHGIIVLKNKLKIGYYYWPRIEKVWHKGKFFMIKVIDKNSEDKTYGFEMPDRIASNRIHKSCKDHKEFFKLSQSSRTQNLFKHLDGNKSPVRLINQDFNRPNPSLVRISSRRFKRTGKPDGSEIPNNNDSKHKTNLIENNKSMAISRFNSTLSLSKTDYSTTFNDYKTEIGLFSKSASASPLSVRSAFVSRYDYGRMNYVSPMKRNHSSSSLRRNRSSRSTDNDSDVSRVSRRSSKSYNSDDRKILNNGSHLSRSKRKYYMEPRMVEWNDILDKRQNFPPMSNAKHCSNAIVKNVNKVIYSANDSDSDLEDRKYKIKNINKSLPIEIQKYIFHEPIDTTGFTELEKKNIHFTNIKSKFSKMDDHLKHTNLYQMNNIDINKKIIRTNDKYHLQKINGFMDKIGFYEKSLDETNLNNCAQYCFDQRNQNNMVNMNQTSSPRVTFLPSHSTAYYSNNDDYKRNANNSADHSSKEVKNKNNEMSTEL